MDGKALDQLLALQTISGAFPSTVETVEGQHTDETCFITANVVLLLTEFRQNGHGSCKLMRSIERGLDFVERCAAPELSGAFRFYPEEAEGYQVNRDLPPDADDTALAWMALVAAGRRSKAQAVSTLEPLFTRCRTRARSRGDAPWVRSEVYRTWLDTSSAPNPADLCVNINILACRAMVGLPPELSVVETLESALSHWALTPENMRVLAPYYAHPDELEYAIARAIKAGAMSVKSEQALPPVPREDQPLYCNSHGRPIWRSPALHRARQLQRALIQPKEIVHAPDAAICF